MVAGAALAWQRRDDLSFLLFGDEAAIRAELAKHRGLAGVSARSSIATTSSPATTSRARRSAAPRPRSMGRAIAAVKEGEADAAVSGGNTGALMAMSKLALAHHAGHRPAGARRLAADAGRQ